MGKRVLRKKLAVLLWPWDKEGSPRRSNSKVARTEVQKHRSRLSRWGNRRKKKAQRPSTKSTRAQERRKKRPCLPIRDERLKNYVLSAEPKEKEKKRKKTPAQQSRKLVLTFDPVERKRGKKNVTGCI